MSGARKLLVAMVALFAAVPCAVAADAKIFTIDKVVVNVGSGNEATITFDGTTGIAQIPFSAISSPIKIKGTYRPKNANVTAKILVQKMITNPPAAWEYPTSNNNGDWEITIAAITPSGLKATSDEPPSA